jgi:hypothetical protein
MSFWSTLPAQDWRKGTQGFINSQWVRENVQDFGVYDNNIGALGVSDSGNAPNGFTKIVFLSHRFAIWVYWWFTTYLFHISFAPVSWRTLLKSSGSAVVARQKLPREASAGLTFQGEYIAFPQLNDLGPALKEQADPQIP